RLRDRGLRHLEMFRSELPGRLLHQQDLTIDRIAHGIFSHMAVLDAVDRIANAQLHRLCAAYNAIRRPLIPQGNIAASPPKLKRVASAPKSATLVAAGGLRG